ncbi:MAG: regulatory protein RecX [Xanthomonadales bacterium]|nr:regulatory protein RecX [Xanthomonadales bacterium]
MRAFAYRLLGRREYSIAELVRRLEQKWPQAGDIGSLVESLVDENLLSDRRFAESFVRSRLQRSQGPLKIKAALRAKGVGDGDIAAALTADDGQWAELAAAWLQRQHAGALDYDDRKKYYRRLVSRGFTHEQAMEAINRL